MPTLKDKSSDIYYQVEGKGAPIDLIHGFGLDRRIWKKQVEELSKTNRVITYDMRGFGESSLPEGEYNHADDLHKLLKELGIERSKIVGHSLGGQVAIEYALKYPDEVNSLVLISTALSGVRGDTSEWEVLSELGRKGDVEGVRRRMLGNPTFDDLKEGSEERELVKEIINDYSAFHFMKRDPRESDRENQRLIDLSCPIEVVIGEKDEEVQKEIAKKFKDEIGVEARVIPKAGHMVILEEPGLISNIVRNATTKEYHSETSQLN